MNPINDNISSGHHISYWLFSELLPLEFEQLRANSQTEVVIIGGGIAGLSVAYQLLKRGKQVVVIEDGHIGSGETGRTTAHLTNALDDRYYELEKLFGEEAIKLIAQSHTDAINFIEEVCKAENIDCGFERVKGYLFLHPNDEKDNLEKELEAATKAGLDVTMINYVPGMQKEKGPCLEFNHQAQFHPLRYLEGLCKAIIKMGGKIYTLTHAGEISEKGIRTDEGYWVEAQQVVVATNVPVNSKYVLPMKQFPYRTYVIGAKIKGGQIKPALWWDTGDHMVNPDTPPYHYVRIQKLDDQYDLLICGGEDHPTGLTAATDAVPEEHRYKLLEAWARERFEIDDVIYHWSGQVMEPLDGMAYIGKNPFDKDNVYIATGDSGNGLTHGTIAGILLSDLICGVQNPYEKIYAPSRIQLHSIGTFFKEFVTGFITYLKNKPDTDEFGINDIHTNEGKVIEWKKKKCGIYRDDEDLLHIVDAECTHLKCIINWNNDEKSWDCPCHGSRFTADGKVINGPANTDLNHYTEKMNFWL
jgi:glycine/D-amino acid oxidase-like deaminating enzyme/nitrite reductase/ring-hydroxylating ferredoxin subunit